MYAKIAVNYVRDSVLNTQIESYKVVPYFIPTQWFIINTELRWKIFIIIFNNIKNKLFISNNINFFKSMSKITWKNKNRKFDIFVCDKVFQCIFCLNYIFKHASNLLWLF